jgi:hypothetical protein
LHLSLTGTQIKLALYNTAEDLGTPGEDNTYGMGLIDVYAAFLSLGTADATPPDPITDLAILDTTSNSLSFSWTVPGDTSMGGVTGYDIRWSNTMINDTNDFNAASQITFTEQPKDSGQVETFVHDGLDFSTDYYYAVRSRDVWGNWSDLSNVVLGTTFEAPVADATPDSVHILLLASTSEKDTVYLSNISTGTSTLDYNISLENNVFPTERPMNIRLIPVHSDDPEEFGEVEKDNALYNHGMSIEGAGGPDTFGYEWIDSDEPGGPAYVWNDISATGTAATGWTATGSFDPLDEGYAGPFALGFPFKFYGEEKTEIYISSNGLLTFQAPTSNNFTNSSLPNSNPPNELICPFWDDLDGRSQGTVHYLQDGNKFIVQFTNWQKYSGTGSLTFQIVLYSSGRILFYYNNMNATLTSSTVGIENANGSDGLQIAYNASYIANGLAVKIQAEPDWLAPNHLAGMLYNGNTALIELSFSDDDYPTGDYSMELIISSNDPVNPQITIPVTMEIAEIPVELTSFKADLMDNIVGLYWQTATETNNSGFEVERKFGTENSWNKLGFKEGRGNSTETTSYHFEDSFEGNAYRGSVSYRLKQIDLDGSVNYSDVIQVDVDFTPKSYSLEQNYPNPFNPSTTIKYSLPNESNVKLTVYTALGEVAIELVNSVQETGFYQVQFDASALASGLYIYTLEAEAIDGSNNFRNSMKMLLIK